MARAEARAERFLWPAAPQLVCLAMPAELARRVESESWAVLARQAAAAELAELAQKSALALHKVAGHQLAARTHFEVVAKVALPAAEPVVLLLLAAMMALSVPVEQLALSERQKDFLAQIAARVDG